MNKSVYDIVYNYPTKYQVGFTNSEIEEVLKNFPNLNREFYLIERKTPSLLSKGM
jgi:hypothetical protein